MTVLSIKEKYILLSLLIELRVKFYSAFAAKIKAKV